MKRWIKRLLRVLAIAVVALLVFALLAVAAVHSSFIVRSVVLPMVNRNSPVHIALTSWRLRIWSSLALEGLSVREVTPDGTASNILVDVKSLDVHYHLASLLSRTPQIDRIIIDRPVIGLAARKAAPPAAPAPRPPAPPPPRAEEPSAPAGLPRIPVPLSIGELRIRNARCTYIDHKGTHADISGLNLSAERIGPHRRGVVTLDATVALTDGKDMVLSRLPLALRLDTRLDETVIPSSLALEVAVSNIAGRINNMDVQPLAALFSLCLHRRGPAAFDLTQCDASVRWNEALLAYVSITGMVDAARQETINNLVVKVNSSPLWQALLGPHKMLDVSGTKVDIALATHARGAEHAVDARLAATVHNVRVRGADGTELAPFDLEARAAAAIDARAGQLALPELNIAAAQNQRAFFTARALQPITLFWKDSARRAAAEKATLDIVLDRLGLAQLNAFMGGGAARIHGGVCSARVECDVIEFGKSLAVRGALNIGDLNLRINEAHWHDLDLTMNYAAEARQMQFIALQRVSAQLASDNVPAGQIAAGGFYDMASGTNRIALAISKLSGSLLQPLLDPQKQNPRLAALDITLQMLTEKADASRVAQQIGLVLAVENAARRARDEWDKLALNLHAALRPDLLRLHRCTLNLQPARFTDNQLSLSGEVMLAPTNVPSTLALNSPQFDATVLLDTFMPAAAPAAKKTSTKPAQNKNASPQPTTAPAEPPEPPPVPVQGRDTTVRVRIEELRARELLVMPLYLDAVLKDAQLSLRTPDLRVNSGRVTLSADVDLGVTGYTYHVALAVTNLPLLPIVNTFAPQRRDTVDGLLVADASLSGQGIRMTNLCQYLRGSISAGMLDGRLMNIPVLSDVGRALRLETLENYSFGDGQARLQILTGIVHVASIALQGPLARVNLRGTATLQQQLDLMLHLALTGKGITDLFDNKLPFSSQIGRYYDLPLPIPITGPLADPNIGVSYTSLLDKFMPVLGVDPRSMLQDVIDKIPTDSLRKEVDSGVKMIRGLFDNVTIPGSSTKQR